VQKRPFDFPGEGLYEGQGQNGEKSQKKEAKEASGPPCPQCGSVTIPNGACHVCPNCGETTGCG